VVGVLRRGKGVLSTVDVAPPKEVYKLLDKIRTKPEHYDDTLTLKTTVRGLKVRQDHAEEEEEEDDDDDGDDGDDDDGGGGERSMQALVFPPWSCPPPPRSACPVGH
jgi:hypothetical protein